MDPLVTAVIILSLTAALYRIALHYYQTGDPKAKESMEVLKEQIERVKKGK